MDESQSSDGKNHGPRIGCAYDLVVLWIFRPRRNARIFPQGFLRKLDRFFQLWVVPRDHELGTDDILFKQKGKKDIPGNYSVVNSAMKLIYASIDVLWSTKLSKNVEFEYGAGFGIGAVFGDLQNDWVQLDPNGPYKASNNNSYRRCDAVGVSGLAGGSCPLQVHPPDSAMLRRPGAQPGGRHPDGALRDGETS